MNTAGGGTGDEGTAAPGLSDFRVSPLGSTYPGVEILATAIDNLDRGDWLREGPAALKSHEKTALLADAESMDRLHRAVWTRPLADLRPFHAAEVVAAARVHLEHSGVTVRYLETVDPETLVVTHEPGPARLLFAGTVGATRLLDNWAVDIPDER